MNTQVIAFDKIDWCYDLWKIRYRRIAIGVGKKRTWYVHLIKCEPCGGRRVLSFALGKVFGTINCRDARGLVPPPKPKEEFPEFTDDLDFFDAHSTIDA